MIPTLDYHMHTPLCGHASGQPEEYARQAISAGLSEIGFSDHAPFVKGPLPGITMDRDQLSGYHTMIEAVQHEFQGELIIKLGIEADYIPGYEEETRRLLEGYPYDYVYGSVHFIDEWAFDCPDERAAWNDKDVGQVYKAYYRLLRKSAQSGLFDIMSHVDLVKKFGHRPAGDLSDEVRETAQVFKESGVAVEINTSGRRKEVGEMYPALDVLRYYADAKVPLIFGSDAHQPSQVAMDFDQARALALEAGYREYVSFRQRRIESRHSLL
ncbi:MAG: histidinol-phosphatase HisJ family protein [Candidatus Omnitrophota bacterium]